jgi:DNA mismatch repair protein MutS2
MDSHTLELLEFDKIRVLVAARAACSLGKTAALLMAPCLDSGEIHERQALTTEMAEALAAGLRPPFGGLHDIRHHVRRSETGAVLEPEALAETVETLRAIGNLDRWLALSGEQFPRLGGLRQGVGEFSGVQSAIEGCLDNRGTVLDTASRRLSALRREIARVKERIQQTLRQMLRSPEIKRILRFPNYSTVGHHYVLPVAKDKRGEIQGSVLRTSASNETVYIEPAAVGEQSAQLSFLRAREAKEVRRILRWLSAQVGLVAQSLLETLETMAELDLIFARGRLSVDYAMSAPQFNQESRLVLRAARHPLLEAIFRKDPALEKPEPVPPRPSASAPQPIPRAPTQVGETIPALPELSHGSGTEAANAATPEAKPPHLTAASERRVVPIDLNLGVRFRILVVTGPNTGGKTVALKTVGLLAIMAQSGLHVPAGEGSQFPIFDDVLADIGDEQSLEQSLSTFSSHVKRIGVILAKATSRSLVLLDELGAGTDPTDGAALGRAILDELGRIECPSIVTTHIGDLKTYAFSNEGAENAAVEFDEETLEPKYRLHVGDVGQSKALKIARKLRLPEHVVERAESYLADRSSNGLPDWEILEKLRKEAAEARHKAVEAQAEAERTRQVLAQRLAQLHEEAQRTANLTDARALIQVGDLVVVPRLGYDRPGRVVKLDQRKKSAKIAIGHVTWDVSIDELVPQTPRTPGGGGANTPRPVHGKPALPLEDFEEE